MSTDFSFARRNPITYMTSPMNIKEAVKAVKSNKGAPGPDGMEKYEIDQWMYEHGKELIEKLEKGTYKPELLVYDKMALNKGRGNA